MHQRHKPEECRRNDPFGRAVNGMMTWEANLFGFILRCGKWAAHQVSISTLEIIARAIENLTLHTEFRSHSVCTSRRFALFGVLKGPNWKMSHFPIIMGSTYMGLSENRILQNPLVWSCSGYTPMFRHIHIASVCESAVRKGPPKSDHFA